MKILIASVVLLASALVPALHQDPMELPKPGPQHALLQKLVGTWDAVITMHDMEGVEQKSKGSMTTRNSGEFHIVDEYRGEFMGMPFEGHGVTSYCPIRKKFMTSWTDSMSPSPMQNTGDYDDKAKQLKMAGECVGMSGKLEPCRTVIHFQDADHYAFEMFGPGPDGAEARMIRIDYTRKK